MAECRSEIWARLLGKDCEHEDHESISALFKGPLHTRNNSRHLDHSGLEIRHLCGTLNNCAVSDHVGRQADIVKDISELHYKKRI
jgi:hypothetical protein